MGSVDQYYVVLVAEEGQPDFLEQAINAILRRKELNTKIIGKKVFPMAGEYTSEVMLRGVYGFLKDCSTLEPHIVEALDDVNRLFDYREEARAILGDNLPLRTPSFCTGCPERPIFSALKIMQKELGQAHISADIGCHTFAAFKF